MVGAIGPLKSIFNVSSAMYTVFSKPYEGGLQKGDVIGAAKGFGEGMGNLYSVLAEEKTNALKKVTKIGEYISRK